MSARRSARDGDALSLVQAPRVRHGASDRRSERRRRGRTRSVRARVPRPCRVPRRLGVVDLDLSTHRERVVVSPRTPGPASGSQRRFTRRGCRAAADDARPGAREPDRTSAAGAASRLSRHPGAPRRRGPVARRMRDDPRVPRRHLQVAAPQGARAHARAARPDRRTLVTCEDVRTKLTAYLDGELEGDRGSAIRGHLRGCDACRGMAADEAALRDELRALPPLDPPHTLWSGIQRRLAAEEVADSDRPAWRRAVARFAARWKPLAPQLALGSAALAAAVVVLAVRYNDRHPTSET